ncbi:MAG: RNA polymerase factor sigma-54 [Clostridiales Family XIII bacterium]|jgi:RNA polymerase sigma-54 factor|nr:RNA polymerase factor sigma-54 [Clostridiales Family XIII bacterium]
MTPAVKSGFGYDLTIGQSQKTVMAPELIQAVQILQFDIQELEAYVEEQLLTNPVLELEADLPPRPSETEAGLPEESFTVRNGNDDFDWPEYLKEREYDDISYGQWGKSGGQNRRADEHSFSPQTDLTEYLMSQLRFSDLKKSDRKVGEYVIESLDSNGYMTQSAEEIAARLKIRPERAAYAVKTVQSFDPPGVGASGLRECLSIQLARLGIETPETTIILQNHLEDIAENRLNSISKALCLPVCEVQRIADVIRGLEPKPGRKFGTAAGSGRIIPDAIVENIGGSYVVTVNENTPKLVISAYCRKILREAGGDSSVSDFLAGRLDSAVWLIKSIEQRKQTIYNVVSAVVKYQIDFFEKGWKRLKPLSLKQIARETGVHESTVSRAVNGKYMQTHRGFFEIKYFFTSGVSANSGGSVSSESIKAFIGEMIAGENPASPLSDQVIADRLVSDGINISRRTVAKYRDEMKLPSSSRRRRY